MSKPQFPMKTGSVYPPPANAICPLCGEPVDEFIAIYNSLILPMASWRGRPCDCIWTAKLHLPSTGWDKHPRGYSNLGIFAWSDVKEFKS